MIRTTKFVAVAALILFSVGACRGTAIVDDGLMMPSKSDTQDAFPPLPAVASVSAKEIGGAPIGFFDSHEEAAPADAPPAGDAMPMPAEEVAPEPDIQEAVMADRRRFLAQKKLEAARQHIRNGEYEDARDLLRDANKLDPGNSDVQYELNTVEGLLGNRPDSAGAYLEGRAGMAKLRADAQRTKVAKLNSLGQMHLANDRYDSAIEAFEDALFIINTAPISVDWGNAQGEATNGLRQAKNAKADAKKQRHRDTVERGLSELAKAEEQELIRDMERLAKWMGEAIAAFERNQFDLAEEYASRVLDEQPDNTKARELMIAAQRAQHDKRQVDHLRREKIAFREWLDDINRTRIAQDRIMSWPSRSFWQKITDLRAKSRPSFGKVDEDPEAAELMKKIEGTTVNLTVDEQSFPEVVKTLQIQTGFNIVVDPRISGTVADATVSKLTLTDVAMPTVLNMLQDQGGDENIVWTTKGNMVLFTSKEHLDRNMIVEIHSISDLTTGLTDFIPPTIQLVGPDQVSDEDSPLFGTEAEEPVFPYGSADELIELVKSAVQPNFWEDVEGANIASQGEGTLVVKATPEIQEQIASFLDDLRGFAGIVVTVESRFLEVSENFLRDVGVDFRGLGGQTPGTLVNLDDVTNGLEDASSAGFDNGGVGTAALNPSAGAYFNDGGDGDFRARTENIFDNPLGTVLSSVGGATLTLSYLDDTEVSMIIRATEKSLAARTLTAPIITVYNTQRANLTMVNQISYIQDFDVEVAQTSFIADPIVGIIQDGLTLDVRPTVSNDRRYITLELQPTVANVRRPIQEFATSLASSFAPVIIQLPELRLQQARTTVRIPDQGSILIGGLKEIRTVDRTTETPILGKIPLLTFLFSRKGRSDEVSHLLILVRAEITDLRAQEEDFMNGR